MVTILCKLCLRPVEVQAWTDHVASSEHVENLPDHLIVKAFVDTSGKEIIGKIGHSLPEAVDKIHDYFAKFGKIATKELVSFANKRVIIKYSFENGNAHSVVIHKQHQLLGKQLEIAWYKASKPLKKPESDLTYEVQEISSSEEEPEDVPSDFFDDFSDDSFLDGLNIPEGRDNKRNAKKRKKVARKRSPSVSVSSRRRKGSRSRSTSRDRNKRRRWDVTERVKGRSRSKGRRRYSLSPERNEINRRKSFLEEIRDKLNGIETPSLATVRETAPQLPTPVPLPSTLTVVPTHDTGIPTYDRSFFIGTEKKYNHDHITKLFDEKKISIHDYLTIRAKYEDRSWSPDQMLKKIKVISQCENLLKVMSYQKFGKVSVQPLREPHPKHLSPLHKTTARIRFTCRLKGNSDVLFSDILYKTFQRVGIFSDESNVWKMIDSVADTLTNGASMDNDVAAKILQISLLSQKIGNRKSFKTAVGTQSVGHSTGVSVEVQTGDEEEVIPLCLEKRRR